MKNTRYNKYISKYKMRFCFLISLKGNCLFKAKVTNNGDKINSLKKNTIKRKTVKEKKRNNRWDN